MFESRISAGVTEKLPGWDKRGPTTWKDRLENAWNGIANWQTRRQSIYTRFLVLSWTTPNQKKKLENKFELSEFCSHIVSRCLYLARSGRPDILWSVNKLARSVTKWTPTCDRRLARLISYFHFTSDYRQYCHVGNAAQHCRLGLFQDSDFAGDEKTQNQHQAEFCAFSEVEHCTDQLAVKKANVSVSQLHRVRDHIVGCWFAYGGFTCARLVGFGY